MTAVTNNGDQNQIQQYAQETVKLNQLKFWKENPNILSKEGETGLRTSLNKFGYLEHIVIDQNNLIISGNHRAQALIDLGEGEVTVLRKEFKDDVERIECAQVMNKLHGQYEKFADSNQLLKIFESQKLDELAQLIGQSQESLQEIITRGHPEIQFHHEDNFDVDKTLEELVPATQLGDIWQCGDDHRILCADNSDQKSLKKLFQDATVDQLNTDPPYGVLYGDKNAELNKMDGGKRIETQYENDETDHDYRETFNHIFKNTPFSDYNSIYVWSGDPHVHQIRMAFDDNKIKCSQYLIWVKNNHVLGRKDYNAKAEFCLYCWKGKHEFYGPFRTTLLEYDKPLANKLHPTMKPIAMIAQLITDGTRPQGIVYDPFLGSGTTLIACEQTRRTCYCVEIDPRYVDVCVKRWEAFTKRKAKKLGSKGES